LQRVQAQNSNLTGGASLDECIVIHSERGFKPPRCEKIGHASRYFELL
jgi:hypothetical protein